MLIKPFALVFLLQIFKVGAYAPTKHLKCWLWDSKCLVDKAQAVPSILSPGIPKLNIQPLHTIVIDYFHVNRSGYIADYRSMQVKGMREAIIDNIRVDIPSKSVQLTFHADLFTKSEYVTCDSTLLSMPIYGEGDLYMNLENVEITMNIDFNIISDVRGKYIMDLKTFEYNYNVKDGAQFHFTELYNGDKHLSEKMHKRMHQKWKYLTVVYASYLLDPLTNELFKAIKYYVRSKPLESVILFEKYNHS